MTIDTVEIDPVDRGRTAFGRRATAMRVFTRTPADSPDVAETYDIVIVTATMPTRSTT
jgi:hypothetical protein